MSVAISRDASQLPPVALKLEINPTVAVTTKEMVARLNNPNVQIVDVRTPKEFIGEDIRAIRGGHVPGAINIPYEQNWIDPETPAKLARKQITNNAGMSLKPAEDLKRLSTARVARVRRRPRACFSRWASQTSRFTIRRGWATAIPLMRPPIT